ncbi:helix-turn-helix domain-containing protein [Microvirga flavescens]|uniref:helix-turn-helix domain-containing protein n=1 Tax=Microvirga flavescens TaxID=2249811 RepID=UPI0013005567|nr:helix-turn-helix transcriptional regulator [Microvirga flavescens]
MDKQPGKLTPKVLTKHEFGKRLRKLMADKGWHQSELARQAGLQRDSVSTYINGRSLPTPLSLNRLAAALGVAAEDLIPNHLEQSLDHHKPAFEMKASASAPDMAWVRVNRLVTFDTAVKIGELLRADNAIVAKRAAAAEREKE